jgi:hypothetical protein
MLNITFDEFKKQSLATGAHEVLERKWAADTLLQTHTHSFSAKALVAEGELWLTTEGNTKHLTVGGTFELSSGTPHSERYGPEGATYWVARTND